MIITVFTVRQYVTFKTSQHMNKLSLDFAASFRSHILGRFTISELAYDMQTILLNGTPAGQEICMRLSIYNYAKGFKLVV
jgi:hypothetical protein